MKSEWENSSLPVPKRVLHTKRTRKTETESEVKMCFRRQKNVKENKILPMSCWLRLSFWCVQDTRVCIFSLSERRFAQEIAYITESSGSNSHAAFSVYARGGCGSPIYSCSVGFLLLGFFFKYISKWSKPFWQDILLQYGHPCHFLPVFWPSGACALCKGCIEKSPRCEQGADCFVASVCGGEGNSRKQESPIRHEARDTLRQFNVEGKTFFHQPVPRLFKADISCHWWDLGKAGPLHSVDPTQRISFKLLVDASI